MLIYSRAIPENDQEPLQWPEDVVVRGSVVSFYIFVLRCTFLLSLQRDVLRHNQLFLRDISQGNTSTATSETIEISVPSSTSVSGFTTPLEMPVTPGEAMDVSN